MLRKLYGLSTSIILNLSLIASVYGQWQSPIDISSGGIPAEKPQVAISIDGSTALAVWLANPGGSNSLLGAVGTVSLNTITWGAPTTIVPSGVTATSPRIALSTDGSKAILVWTHEDMGLVQIRSKTAAISGTAATWSATSNLSAAGGDADGPDVAISQDGLRATAIWYRSSGGVNVAQSASATVLNNVASWGSVTDLSASTESVSEQRIEVSADGSKATALWVRDDGMTNDLVQSASAQVSGSAATWGAVVNLNASGFAASKIDLALSDDGSRATAVWRYFAGSGRWIAQSSSAVISSGVASWGVRTDLSQDGENADSPRVSLSANGATAIAVWTRETSNMHPAVQSRSAAIAGNAATWGALSQLSPTNRYAYDPQVALSPNGTTAIAVWSWNTSPDFLIEAAIAAVSGDNATFGAKTAISTAGGSATVPQIAISQNGALALSVWRRPVAGIGQVQGAIYGSFQTPTPTPTATPTITPTTIPTVTATSAGGTPSPTPTTIAQGTATPIVIRTATPLAAGTATPGSTATAGPPSSARLTGYPVYGSDLYSIFKQDFGTGVRTTVVSTGTKAILDLRVNAKSQTLFFVTEEGGKSVNINTKSLASGGSPTSFSPIVRLSVEREAQVKIDITSTHLYWVQFNGIVGKHKVYRSSLTGSNREAVSEELPGFPVGLTILEAFGAMYIKVARDDRLVSDFGSSKFDLIKGGQLRGYPLANAQGRLVSPSDNFLTLDSGGLSPLAPDLERSKLYFTDPDGRGVQLLDFSTFVLSTIGSNFGAARKGVTDIGYLGWADRIILFPEANAYIVSTQLIGPPILADLDTTLEGASTVKEQLPLHLGGREYARPVVPALTNFNLFGFTLPNTRVFAFAAREGSTSYLPSVAADVPVASTTSNGLGFYEFTDLTPGTYRVTVQADGYETQSVIARTGAEAQPIIPERSEQPPGCRAKNVAGIVARARRAEGRLKGFITIGAAQYKLLAQGRLSRKDARNYNQSMDSALLRLYRGSSIIGRAVASIPSPTLTCQKQRSCKRYSFRRIINRAVLRLGDMRRVGFFVERLTRETLRLARNQKFARRQQQLLRLHGRAVVAVRALPRKSFICR